MKLSIRLAGLCASGTFILTALPGFYQQVKPTNIASMATEAIPGMTILETLAISLGGALLASFLGYVIGDILSNPKGKSKKQIKALKMQARELSVEPVMLPEAVPAISPASYVEEAVEAAAEAASIDEPSP